MHQCCKGLEKPLRKGHLRVISSACPSKNTAINTDRDRRQVEGITLIISLSEHQGYFWATNDGFILRVYASDVGKMGDRQDLRRSDKGKFRPLAGRPPSPITQKILPNIYKNFNLKDVFSYFYFLPFNNLILCKQSQSIILFFYYFFLLINLFL